MRWSALEHNKHILKNGLKISLCFMHPYLWNQLNLLIYSNQGSKRQVNVRKLYAILKIVASTVSEKTVTQIYPQKTEKWTNKGKNKSNEPHSQSNDTTTYCP